MKAIAVERLTRSYLGKLYFQNYLAAIATFAIVSLSVYWLVFRIGGQYTVTLFSDSLYAASSLIGAWWAFVTAYRMRYGPVKMESRYQLAWLLIGIGLLANSAGGFDYPILEQRGYLNPVPSTSDIGFTLFYICGFAGLLILPKQSGKRRFHPRIGLDALITTLCLFGVSWFFLLSKVFLLQKAAHVPLPTLITVLSYPCWDIVLLSAIILFFQTRTAHILYPSLLICAAGILSIVFADSAYAYTIANNTYFTGTPYIDPFWFIGYILIGLAALYQYTSLLQRAYNENTLPRRSITRPKILLARSRNRGVPNRLRGMLIYLPPAALIILMLYSEVALDNNSTSTLLVLLTAAVGILMTARHLLILRENERLLQEREQRREASEHLQDLSTQLSKIFELDLLLTGIVNMAITELGFESAMLILIEEQDRPLSAYSHLLVRAAAALPGIPSPEPFTCRLHGSRTPFCTVLNRKQVEVFWPDQALALPPEVERWQSEQGIHTTLFMPLTYKEKTLGSLAFSRRAMQPFSEDEHYVARRYSELAAAAIEHVQLYQTAREHEIFAKAMANIATRLNSAVVEPAEIHQFICREGANALRADYALLYGSTDDGKMVPLAAYVSEQEPGVATEEWPVLPARDPDAQALHSLQPMLISTHSACSLDDDFSLNPISLPLPRPGSYQAPRFLQEPSQQSSSLRELLKSRHVQTAILAPLIAYGDATALLILGRSVPSGTHDKRSFEFTDLSLAQDFSEQAAVAFNNALLYQQQLAAHQRLQELDQLKDQFMITASHELRTPLTAVQGYLELLAQYDEMLPPEQRREFLQKVQRSCDELVLLLDNVMDASRLETEAGLRPVHLETVSLEEMIDGVVMLIEPQLTKEERELRVQIPAPLFVQADPGRLRQVLMNISTNALKYSPPGTPITYSARAVIDQESYIVISISDKGKGIAPEDQAQLFQRFVRLESDINSPIRGSGLGLYISRRLVEAMHGTIWIESSGIPGEGSIFHIKLPMASYQQHE
ncbi:MAG TPA: GAF domain-containing sensor histidine kinase [Ktedonobacteraceae bacterium]|nr:GAF domain-containing sensor histidine kinase [Ktedonobacteraceae bacterium]